MVIRQRVASGLLADRRLSRHPLLHSSSTSAHTHTRLVVEGHLGALELLDAAAVGAAARGAATAAAATAATIAKAATATAAATTATVTEATAAAATATKATTAATVTAKAATAAATAAKAAAVTARAVVAAGLGVVEGDGAAVKLAAVELLEGSLGLLGAGIVDKAKALGAAALAVHDDAGRLAALKVGAEVVVVDVPGEVLDDEGGGLGAERALRGVVAGGVAVALLKLEPALAQGHVLVVVDEGGGRGCGQGDKANALGLAVVAQENLRLGDAADALEAVQELRQLVLADGPGQALDADNRLAAGAAALGLLGRPLLIIVLLSLLSLAVLLLLLALALAVAVGRVVCRRALPRHIHRRYKVSRPLEGVGVKREEVVQPVSRVAALHLI
eukprot:m.177124 g.177124  ORF g.177124 m.177124 type:complete len:390 (-) comp17374_c1_seq1:2639-3808(-)